MPITIREILASDTISGAADKINFNFDQLLLNGGGPPGPLGPPGPIGPIGGRGIRGSVWYEGLGDPNLVPPTLTPEDEDNYLRGDGFVWTYNGSIWVNTTIDLTGPVGPAGASGKFAEYQAQPLAYSTAGDTTMFPIPMALPPAGVSTNSSNLGVRSVIIGGFPGGLTYPPTTFPNTGEQIIVSSLATQIVQPEVSLFVHQFNSGSGGIKFHGGNAIVDNFTNIITELTEIRLLRDDALYINVPKAATLPASVTDVDGLIVRTPLRGQLYQSGKRIQFQTGVSTSGYTSGDTNDFIVDAARNGSGSDPTIQLNVLGTTSAPTAAFRLGSVSTAALPIQNGDARLGAGLITIDGSTSITGTSPEITLNGSTSTRIFAGSVSIPPANGHLTLGAASQVNMFTTNGSATGSIVIATGNSTPGNVVIATGTTSTGNILVSTSAGSGRVNLTSGAGNSGGLGAINLVTDLSSVGDIKLLTGTTSTGDIAISTSAGSGRVNIRSRAANSGSLGAINLATDPTSTGDIAISTSLGTGRVNISSDAAFDPLFPLLGAINIVTDSTSTGDILVSTGPGTGRVNITSKATNSVPLGLGAINLVTNSASAGDIRLLTGTTSLGDIQLKTGTNSTGDIRIETGTNSTGGIVVSTSLGTSSDVFILSNRLVLISHGASERIIIQPDLGSNSDALIDIKPSGTGNTSTVNIFHDAAATKNFQLKSILGLPGFAYPRGEINASNNMRILLNSGINNSTLSSLGASDDPGVNINSTNHYVHTTQISTIRNTAIISSGEFTGGFGPSAYTLYWQRVGNVISCSGIYTRSAIGGGSDPSEALPIIGSGGTSTPHGSGTVILTATSVYHPVQIGAGLTTNTFGITAAAGVDLLLAISIKFSFSYVIA